MTPSPYLTAREQEIAVRVRRGLPSKLIAREFDLSVRTVETHRLNIRRKTGLTRARKQKEMQNG